MSGAYTRLSSRAFRNQFSAIGPNSTDVSFDTPSFIAKVRPGQYGKHVSVLDDGTILIANTAYVDDALAAFVGFQVNSPVLPTHIKLQLGAVLDAFDKHAFERHGYADSVDEAVYQWTSVADTMAKRFTVARI
jgi:hypothetical protein